MIKVHEVEKKVKELCQKSFVLDKFNRDKANAEISQYLASIEKSYHHIEHDVKDNVVKVLLYTSEDDGYDLSFKITTLKDGKENT